VERLLVCAEAVVAHQVNHHVKQSNDVILSTGPKKLHVINTCKQKVSLKKVDGLTPFNMCILLFLILELVDEPEIDDGYREL